MSTKLYNNKEYNRDDHYQSVVLDEDGVAGQVAVDNWRIAGVQIAEIVRKLYNSTKLLIEIATKYVSLLTDELVIGSH